MICIAANLLGLIAWIWEFPRGSGPEFQRDVQHVWRTKRISRYLPGSVRKAWTGDREARHFRGVRLGVMAISSISESGMVSRSDLRRRHRRRRPLAVSIPPFCQEA